MWDCAPLSVAGSRHSLDSPGPTAAAGFSPAHPSSCHRAMRLGLTIKEGHGALMGCIPHSSLDPPRRSSGLSSTLSSSPLPMWCVSHKSRSLQDPMPRTSLAVKWMTPFYHLLQKSQFRVYAGPGGWCRESEAAQSCSALAEPAPPGPRWAQ